METFKHKNNPFYFFRFVHLKNTKIMKRILLITLMLMSNLAVFAQDSLQGNTLGGNFGFSGQEIVVAFFAISAMLLLFDTMNRQNSNLATQDEAPTPPPLSFEQRLDREIGEFRSLDRFSEVGTKVIEKDGIETYILVKKVNKGRIEQEARAAEAAKKQKSMLFVLGLIALAMVSVFFYVRLF